MIQFKDPGDAGKWDGLDVRVRWLAKLAELWFGQRLHPTLIVTDIDTPGVHMVGSPHYERRALDLRLPGDLAEAEEFAQWINDLFTYGNGLVCVLVGRFDPHGQHNDHIHIQVPKTLASTPYRRIRFVWA